MSRIFRALAQEHVDTFFRSADLLISSFGRCRRLEDAAFRDEGEGSGVIKFTDSSGNNFRVGLGSANAYVLCATLDESSAKAFCAGSYIQIADSSRLLDDIAHSLGSSCVYKFEGKCEYVEERSISRAFSGVALALPNDLERDEDGNPLFPENEMPEWLDDLSARVQAQTFRLENTELFLKKPHRFSGQQEYRLVWMVEGNVEDYKIIRCPSALSYCLPSR